MKPNKAENGQDIVCPIYFPGKSATSPALTIARYNKAQTSALVATFLGFSNFLLG
jgi:hypothetical protein